LFLSCIVLNFTLTFLIHCSFFFFFFFLITHGVQLLQNHLVKGHPFSMHGFFFWWHWSLNSGLIFARQVLLLIEPLHQPFFVMGFFEMGSCGLFAQGWL
jgi:hypothetical protein